MLLSGVVSFALAPVMIHSLGEFYYGVWIVANSILSYYSLCDGGLSLTVQRFVALYRGEHDDTSGAESVNAAVMLVSGIAVGLLGVTGAAVLVAPRFFKIASPDVSTFRWALLLLGSSAAFSFPTRPMAAYLRGIQRFDLCNALGIGALLIRAAGVLVALQISAGIVGVGIATLISACMSLVGHAVVLRRNDSRLLRSGWPVRRRMRELSQFSFYVFLTTLGDYLRFHVDAIVVAKCISVAAVTSYTVCSSLAAYFISVMWGLSAPLMTEIVSLRNKQDAAQQRQFFLFASKITMLAAVLGGVLLLANGRPILRFWVGERFVAAYPVLLALIIAHLFDTGQAPSLHLLYATGKHTALGCWTVLEGIANLCLSVYLAGRFGIEGVALGTVIPMLVIKLAVQPAYTLRVAGVPIRDYLGCSILKPLVIGSVVAVGSWIFAAEPRSVAGLAFRFAWQTALFAALTFTFALEGSQRGALMRAVASRVPLPWQSRVAGRIEHA